MFPLRLLRLRVETALPRFARTDEGAGERAGESFRALVVNPLCLDLHIVKSRIYQLLLVVAFFVARLRYSRPTAPHLFNWR